MNILHEILTPHAVAIAGAMMLPIVAYMSTMLIQRFADFNSRRHKRRRAHAHNH